MADRPATTLPTPGDADTLPAGRGPGALLEAGRAGVGERFELRRLLGRGGFGDVYEAWDRERGALVALKVLQREGVEDVERFKREFRRLADVSHPHLVALHELVATGERWFFTMELVPGTDARSWMRPGEDGPADPGRVREVLRQLALALRALHGLGHVHRDIKPSNVRVTPEGRLVLLDFGLAKGRAEPHDSSAMIGTPAYLAPEQAATGPVGPAADWYGVGTMLYEALAGRLPFEGGSLAVLAAKVDGEPTPLRDAGVAVEPALEALVMGLLARDPAARAGAAEVEDWLAGASPAPPADPRAAAAAASPLGPLDLPFAGRAEELRALHAALDAACGGGRALAWVHGPSGMGKTALVARFLEEAERDRGARALRTRCYDRESIPYKAFDGLVDALTATLRALSDRTRARLLPADLPSLARLFPAFDRFAGDLEARPAGLGPARPAPPDPRERRRRAGEALAELLAAVAATRPLVLWLDDLQWGDVDSADLLHDLTRAAPAPGGTLVVASYRSEDRDTSACLRRLLDRDDATPALDLRVGPLPEPEARAVAARGVPAEAAGDLAPALARESGGHPLFLHELVRRQRLLATAAAAPGAGPATLDGLLAARVRALPGDARRVLEAIAVAGGPVPARAASDAAAPVADPLAAVGRLRAESLVRGAGAGAALDVFHDRVRAVVLGGLGPEPLRAAHGRLARALHALRAVEPETLAEHYAAAGEPEEAARYAVQAARRAEEALAFDRAATLYDLALSLGRRDAAEALGLRVARGHALALAGRGREAADAYRAVLPEVGEDLRRDLAQRAADQLLRAGHIDEGLEVARGVLGPVGVRVARTPARAVAGMLARRARLRLRGLAHRPCDAASLPRETLAAIDVCWAVGMGLALVDVLRGQDVHTHALLRALDAGEPYRLARSLALEAGYRAAMVGHAGAAETAGILQTARLLAAGVQDPHARAMVEVLTGNVAWCEGRWDDCARLTGRGLAILRDQCAGAVWERTFAQTHHLDALAWMGRWREVVEALPAILEDARRRGDLYAETLMTLRYGSLAGVAADAPERTWEALRALERWPNQGFHIEHLVELYNRVEVQLYTGDGAAAHGDLRAGWRALAWSQLLRVKAFDVQCHGLRGRAGLAAAEGARGPARQRLVGRALADARRIAARGMPFAEPLAALLRAGAARLAGRDEDALAALEAAEAGAEAGHMAMHAACARMRRGALLGGEEGAALARRGAEEAVALGASRPDGVARVLAPGFDGAA